MTSIYIKIKEYLFKHSNIVIPFDDTQQLYYYKQFKYSDISSSPTIDTEISVYTFLD